MYVAEEEEQGAEEVVARSLSIFIIHLSVSIFHFFVISFWSGPRYSLPYSASLKLEQTRCQREPKEQVTDLSDGELKIRVSLASRL